MTADDGAALRLEFDTGVARMLCECGGLGVFTATAGVGPGLWLVVVETDHHPGCPGLAAPERVYLVDAAAWEAGDFTLPGVDFSGRQP